jgi:signal transduction histidine kinase
VTTDSSARGERLHEPQLRRLLEVGRGLVAELDLETVLRQVIETARDMTGARYVALGILDEHKEELERFLYVGIDDETRRQIGPLPRGQGVLGELIRTPKPLRLGDVTEHPRSYGFPPGHPPMTTFLGVPIVVRGEGYGNLYLTEKEGGEEFDESDEELALVLAEWAAIAIDNARLYESVERRRGELERAVKGLEATAAIARTVGFETEMERVLELIVKRGRALVGARSVLVLLAEGDELQVAAAAGEGGAELVGRRLSIKGSLLGGVLTSGSTERVASLETRVAHGLDAIARGARSALVAPLGFRGRAHGVLVALDRMEGEPEFDADYEHLITSFAASAAITIATAQSVGADRLRDTLHASEEERKRWARELHDETLQELGALKVVLQAAKRSGRLEALEQAVGEAMEQIDLSIRGLQSLISELRPAALDELGVKPALEALIARTRSVSGLEIEARLELPTQLDLETSTAIYRLVQETLTNISKHADAERAWIDVVHHGGTVEITVRDDGKGFDPKRADGGFGLIGMKERIALIEGRLAIESASGSGTTVRAEIPVHRDQAPAVARTAS